MSTALITSYSTAYNRLRLLAGAQIGQLWDQFGGLDDVSMQRFVARAVPTIAGAETTQARLTIGYLTELRRQTLGSAPTVTFDVRDLIGANLRGVDPTEVFARPTVTARTAISQGKDFLEAVGLARQRATELAETNVMLTQRATTAAMGATDKRVVGYRRVLTGDSCVLCATASTQRYHRGQLHPIHSHCDCGVAEIYGHADPGQVINSRLLEQLKVTGASGELSLSSSIANAKKSVALTDKRMAEIRTQLKAETDRGRQSRLQDRLDSYQQRRQRDEHHVAEQTQHLADFRKGRVPPNVVTVHHHGELGPVLTREGDHFTTEAEALH